MIWSELSCTRGKLFLLLAGTLLLSSIQSHCAAPPGWVLDWSDEFDGSSLDTNKWNQRLRGPRNDAINTQSAVSVPSGVLPIPPYTEGGTTSPGMIGTENLSLPLYG